MKYLIIGQGIAGTALAWTLIQRGQTVTVADAGFPHQSSAAAAGIINPVTGKRYVKSWRFDDFFPVARAFYRAMETALSCRCWEDTRILRLLKGSEECNNWSTRIGAVGYEDLLGEGADAGPWAPLLQPGFQFGEIRQAARVNFPALLTRFREYAAAKGCFRTENLVAGALPAWTAEYDAVIFCEGYRGIQNPYFPTSGWQLSKGEGFVIHFPGQPMPNLKDMVKRQAIAVPLGEGRFWVGATYHWAFEDNGPNPDEQVQLEEHLKEFLHAPYEIAGRFGAIRPTVRDRRPLIGKSMIDPKCFIFNGLGTKGALLAPFWATHLADHLLEGAALDSEVDVRRFTP